MFPTPADYMLMSHNSSYQIKISNVKSPKMIYKRPKVLNLNRLFLKLNWLICNKWSDLPIHKGSMGDMNIMVLRILFETDFPS